MVWTSLHAHFHQVIRTRKLFLPRQRILMAVSGGQDSLCLAKLMVDLQPKWDWQLGIIHCDHRWRSDSQANGEHVREIARGWGIAFYLEVTPMELGSEAVARDWRYGVFLQTAQAHAYTSVVTGHTQSDRAETLLYNLLRGSGADGLQALTWQRQLSPEVSLVRPMLTISRSQTGQFCQEMDLAVWEDTTNTDLKYTRNRIRQELLPYLQAHFNPQVEVALGRTAELLQADVECWQAQAELDLQLVLENHHEIDVKLDGTTSPVFTLKLNCQKLRKLHLSRQRRVMRKFLLEYLGISPNFEQIEKIIALITAPSRSQTDPFPGGAIAFVENGYIMFKYS
ncbi:tRNA lysidine(34) synthetase TilS [Calothrix sp. NIES-3974]|uniref:tRNA lysidine(34) synthetase TilS n=1 Tax=Calothrix sp. NIES-3974 TaxID=2005462 RepID=UPI000B611B81|nr:tRNA lysidine(34) synthetase TilS [Calothrix sp. NIES-3974]BAZ05172.1 PP-loop protein [Calothrix sp. NIES-3974]